MQRRGSRLFIELILMLVVSGIIYLPFIAQFGYYNDDWYSMYAARVAGTNAFHYRNYVILSQPSACM